MYKGRLGIWIFVLSVCCLVSFFMQKIPVWTRVDDVSISIDVKNDADMAEQIVNEKINHFRYVAKSDESDILIRSQSDEKIDGYKKIDEVLYSPIVMYVNSDVQNNKKDTGFIKLTDGSNNSYDIYRIDLYNVLTAMEKDKEWESLNISKDVVKGKIKLTIPNKHCSYYNDVVDLFYFALNDYEIPTEDERAKLKERVDKLIEKCEKVSDINQAIIDEAKNCKNERVFIGPEYLCVRGNMAFAGNNSSYSDTFVPIYFTKHTFVKADIYIKEYTDTNKQEIMTRFENSIFENKKFMREIGWRIKDSTFDVTDVHTYMLKNPT